MTPDQTAALLEMLRAAFPDRGIPAVQIIATQPSGYHVFPEEFARMAAWANAHRDAAVEKWRALQPECDCTAGRTCKWPWCQQRNVEGGPTFPPDPRDAQIARLTSALKEIAAIDFVLHGPGNTHMQAQRIARAALSAQAEGGR
jgi:hypothetical protein